jgi:hypothetical protein
MTVAVSTTKTLGSAYPARLHSKVVAHELDKTIQQSTL